MSMNKARLLLRAAGILAPAACLLMITAGSSGAATAPPTPGPAGPLVAGTMQPLLAYKQCVSGGPDAHDNHVAHVLSGIRSPRLDAPSGYQISCAAAIVAEVKHDKLTERAGVIAVTTAITESSLHDYTQADNGTSLGLFQQQTSEGWGTPAQVEDPAHSTNSFLSVMKQFYPDNRWEKGDIGDICQAVQRSGDPGAYDPEVDAATKIVGQLW